MLYIPVNHGKYAVVDDVDYDLAQFKWSLHKYGHAVRETHGKKVMMHRVILERKIGRPPLPRELTDHRDGDRLNNRRENLRIATHAQNMWNAGKTQAGTNLYRGVSRHRGVWDARIAHHGKMHYLGSFKTPEEAARAFNEAALRLYGEYARINIL